jgi:hypothetical protein
VIIGNRRKGGFVRRRRRRRRRVARPVVAAVIFGAIVLGMLAAEAYRTVEARCWFDPATGRVPSTLTVAEGVGQRTAVRARALATCHPVDLLPVPSIAPGIGLGAVALAGASATAVLFVRARRRQALRPTVVTH